ncbi:phosphoadenosine phosphosulfate reductase family protein [Flavobacterium sp. UMI-01]|uniref:phosphoadenosine phosphosulfate reductase domain-containing protein n=1 Tax=Flavobacterium sp. UMI-01 TaxID=1441053 RepID=UPI001C7DFAD3|nr:phosphoadenosine phosphosulfate reductase family protein [Flavobacterium sp. UMI-01]GIZ08396.1 phosphoadenosine phosphosulfate reductase [Flavobacterium sp. UMI-01]
MGRTAIRGVENVLNAVKKRISFLFDNYDNIQLAFSGGKDSTVLFHLVNEEAKKRDRKFILYFQDQEAEYQGTIDLVEWAMSQPNVIPQWYQVPIFMTNAASHQQLFLWAWGDGENWVREKNPLAIQKLDKKYPKRFYKFNLWVAQQNRKNFEGSFVSIIGLRAEESPDRRFVMFGEDSELFWIRRKTEPHKAYPIIDWSYTDVWKYLIENELKYNKIYDKMYMLGGNLRYFRVSNLVHEKAFRCLTDLQELEPDTYDKLEQRLQGVHTAAMYGKENLMYSIKELPSQFKTWKEYKDFLLESIHPDLKKLFKFQWSRFGDTDDTRACKYMVKRILLCDWEGNITMSKDFFYYTKEHILEKNRLKREDEIIKKWTQLL